jgi:fructoselysine 6-kinase
MKLVAIGDNVVDFYLDQGLIYPGGNALNVAVSAKRNGAEACAYIGITGDDAAALHVLETMSWEGIDAARIRRAYGPNGEATVTLNEEGDRIFVGTNRGIRMPSLLQLRLTEEDLTYIGQYDLIHTSVNSDIEHELERLSEWPVSFDFSTSKRWNEAYLKQVCPHLAYAFFSGSDMSMADIRDLTAYVHELGVKVVGVTRGAEPAQFSVEGIRYEQPPVPADILDTMGAGDSFIGAFLAAYHGTWKMQEALVQAARSAAATCAHYGAFGYSMKK